MKGFLIFLLLSLSFSSLHGYELWKGNTDLRFAMDKAAVDNFHNGNWQSTVGKERGVMLPFYCNWRQDDYMFPENPVRSGALYNVLETGQLKLSFVETKFELQDLNGNLYTAFESTSKPPTGTFPQWHRHLADSISDHYDTAIELKYEFYPTPHGALSALQTGEVHAAATPFTYGRSYGGAPRLVQFQGGCPDNGLGSGKLFKLDGDNRWDDLDDFRASESANDRNFYDIGVTSDCNLYKKVYLRSNVHCLDNSTSLSAEFSLQMYDLISEEVPGATELADTHPQASTSYGTLYRREGCPAPALIVEAAEERAGEGRRVSGSIHRMATALQDMWNLF